MQRTAKWRGWCETERRRERKWAALWGEMKMSHGELGVC